MTRDSICDFVLSITTSNVVCRDKNVKTTFQEGKGNGLGIWIKFEQLQQEIDFASRILF